jgi:hypothetical protein
LAHTAGFLDKPQDISARELAGEFSWDKLKKDDIYLTQEIFAGGTMA